VNVDFGQKQLRRIGNVQSGGNLFERAITRRSADELKLRKKDTVVALAKAKR